MSSREGQQVRSGLEKAFPPPQGASKLPQEALTALRREIPLLMPADWLEIVPQLLMDLGARHETGGDLQHLDSVVISLNRLAVPRELRETLTKEQCGAILNWLRLVRAWPETYVCELDLDEAIVWWSSLAQRRP